MDVLIQLANGTIPPSPTHPATSGLQAQNHDSADAPLELADGITPLNISQLPSQASSTAFDVLNQLARGTIPPFPTHLAAPDLSLQASTTASNVLAQLSYGTIPPSLTHPSLPDLDLTAPHASADLPDF